MNFNKISAPNVHISNQSYDSDWFGGEIRTQTYKVIGNRPYIWEPVDRKYNLLGRSSRQYGSYGSIQLDRSESNSVYKYNSYTGDREMFFYHPADEVYESIVGDNSTLEKSDVKIIGAIVTGKPQQLIALQGESYIKASTFGVLSDVIDIQN